MYVWADGIHVNVRLEEDKLCLLVIVGVRADGTKELIALADGYRESTGSWADLLRDCARRSMRAPILAIGDGALGFWAVSQPLRCGEGITGPSGGESTATRRLPCRHRAGPPDVRPWCGRSRP